MRNELSFVNKNEGFIELTKWNIPLIKEASIKVVTWAKLHFDAYGTDHWNDVVVDELLPVLQGEKPPKPVVFQGNDIRLIYLSPQITENAEPNTEALPTLSYAVESDPRLVFKKRTQSLSPRCLNSVNRVIHDIGLAAVEDLHADYYLHPSTIYFPKKQFGSVIVSGKVPLLDKIFTGQAA